MNKKIFIALSLLALLGFLVGAAALRTSFSGLLSDQSAGNTSVSKSATQGDPLITRAPTTSSVSRVPTPSQDDPVRGKADAPLAIVEFGDYQCQACQQSESVVKQVLAAYPESVKLVWKDFPIFFHSQAKQAAEAAHCAGAQGKFWEYHDALLANKDASLLPSALAQYARAIGLDGNEFDTCLSAGTFGAKVDSNFTDGADYGVDGVPYFFIGNTKAPYTPTLTEFKQIIDAELAKIK